MVGKTKEERNKKNFDEVLGYVFTNYRTFLELRGKILHTMSEKEKANFLHNLGYLYQAISCSRLALLIYEDALMLRKKTRDKRGEAMTLTRIAESYIKIGEKEKVEECTKKHSRFLKKLRIYSGLTR